MKRLCLILLLPLLAQAQDFQFELEPGAFPIEVDGFPAHQPWAGGMNTTTPELCDLDADGDLDYFSGGYTYVWFFQNNGSSTAAQFDYVSAYFDSLVCIGGSGSFYQPNVIFADLDADGDQDAVTSVQYLGISWNSGTVSQWQFNSLPDSVYDTGGEPIGTVRFELADIDADGDLDLFTEDWSPAALRFWENVGTAEEYAFQLVTANWQDLQVSGGYPSPCFADLDADNDLDLLVGAGDGTLSYYRNDGTAQAAIMTPVSSNYLDLDVQENASPELADLDGDGDLDLLVGRSASQDQAETQGDVYFYQNMGTALNPDFQYVTTNYLTLKLGHTAAPRLVDIDADGDPDLFSRIGSRLVYYQNQGSLGNPLYVYQTDAFQGIEVFDLIPWFADLDADGDYDLLAGESALPPGYPGLHLFINQGTPQEPDFVLFTDSLVPGSVNETIILSPWTADIDADGDLDLFVRNASSLYYFENVGTPSRFQFQYITSNWQAVSSAFPDGLHYGCFWDIDDDQDLDLFINSENYGWFPWEKNLTFYRNTGTPDSAVMVLEDEDVFPELMIWQAAPYLLDMDQDGDGDLFVGDTWGGIRYFENTTGQSPVGPKYKPQPQRIIDLSVQPLPGNPSTVISFSLPAPQEIDLSVYNLLGAKVVTLSSGMLPAGDYRFPWEAEGKASGVYIVKLEAAQASLAEKLIVVK